MEYFKDLLNVTEDINEGALEKQSEGAGISNITIQSNVPKSTYEVIKAIKELKNKRTPGEDGISAEVFKKEKPSYGSTYILLSRRCNEEIPKEWKNVLICSIYKKKIQLTAQISRNLLHECNVQSAE